LTKKKYKSQQRKSKRIRSARKGHKKVPTGFTS
jgi:hypothetical protein